MSHTCFHFQFYVIIVYLTVHTAAVAVAAALSPLLSRNHGKCHHGRLRRQRRRHRHRHNLR